jgi:hypothetical protein
MRKICMEGKVVDKTIRTRIALGMLLVVLAAFVYWMMFVPVVTDQTRQQSSSDRHQWLRDRLLAILGVSGSKQTNGCNEVLNCNVPHLKLRMTLSKLPRDI